jgi:hypothetical protein
MVRNFFEHLKQVVEKFHHVLKGIPKNAAHIAQHVLQADPCVQRSFATVELVIEAYA